MLYNIIFKNFCDGMGIFIRFKYDLINGLKKKRGEKF
jgi:hypothetical protein